MELLTYIAKSAGILTLFYVVYLVVLQNDTFFSANRTYLLTGIISALVLPFVTFTSVTIVAVPIVEASQEYTSIVPFTTTETPSETPFNFVELIFYGYLLGIAVMLVRFTTQLYSLLRLLQKHPAKRIGPLNFVEIDDEIAPFSFFNYIVYNPKTHDSEELEMILKHEKVHATQWHSIDLLLANLVRALQWANPVSWFYKSSLEANLEYLADSETAQYLPSKTEYQLALLKASSSLPVPALTNNFYQSFTHLTVFGREIKLDFQNGQVKKRIIMLNKRNSNNYNQLKLTVVLPALALFLWGFNTEEVIEYTHATAEIASGEVAEKAINEASWFSAASTDAELNELETYFRQHHPSSLVKIGNRKRNAAGELTAFSFETKFEGEDRFYTRFDRGDKKAAFTTTYKIEPKEAGVLLVSEIGDEAVQLKITKEQLELFLPENNPLEVASKNVVAKATPTKREPMLGENPLYIINGKEYRKNTLPAGHTIELDGKVEAYNQKEGAAKYGDKGKDGVLYFNGEATFVPVQTTPSATTPVETPLPSKKQTNATKSKKISEELKIANATKEVRIKITKNTTKEELDRIKEELARDHGIVFNYKNLNYNVKNELTSISVSYKGNGMNGSYSVSDDDGGAIDDFYFYMDTEAGTSGFGSERMVEREEARAKMMAKREELRGKVLVERREELEKQRDEMAKVREEIREERNEMREEVAKIRKNSRKIVDEERKIARGYAQVTRNTNGRGAKALITKDTTDEELANIKKEMEAKGVTFSYSRIKRNAKGEITRIKIQSDNGKGSKQTISTSTDDGEPIEKIVIEQ